MSMEVSLAGPVMHHSCDLLEVISEPNLACLVEKLIEPCACSSLRPLNK